MLKVLSKREKIILYITVSLFIFSIGFSGLALPLFKRYDAINTEISGVKAKLAKYKQLLTQKGNIQKRYKEYASAVRPANQSADPLVNLLAETEGLAKAANIRITDIRPQTLEGRQVYKELLVELKTEGALEDYIKLIYKIENFVLLLKIKSLKLSAKSGIAGLSGSFLISQLE